MVKHRLAGVGPCWMNWRTSPLSLGAGLPCHPVSVATLDAMLEKGLLGEYNHRGVVGYQLIAHTEIDNTRLDLARRQEASVA